LQGYRKRFFFEVVIRPLVGALGLVVTTTYGVLFGWWYGRLVRSRERDALLQDVKEELWFLFIERNAQVVTNGDVTHLSALDCAMVTVSAEELLFRFIRWHGEFQTHVSSKSASRADWHELASILDGVLPERITRRSVASLRDAAELIEEHWSLLKDALSPQNYPRLKEKLNREHDGEMRVARQFQNEINRRLYE